MKDDRYGLDTIRMGYERADDGFVLRIDTGEYLDDDHEIPVYRYEPASPGQAQIQLRWTTSSVAGYRSAAEMAQALVMRNGYRLDDAEARALATRAAHSYHVECRPDWGPVAVNVAGDGQAPRIEMKWGNG
ncbi:hypothetical protein HN371_08650 [Candidatus Poribacteria bacterium]|jgi:hypothetical protein|nr:hypothetical protein [Candidatus Poribacteria bacterium]MBT7098053.1 hypothetical protein [Candidatus Poribacteria bacterium]